MQGGAQIPLTVLGGVVSEIDSPSVPPGSSPLCIDCDFTVSSVFSRSGLQNVYTYAGLSPTQVTKCGSNEVTGSNETPWTSPTNIQSNTVGTYASVELGPGGGGSGGTVGIQNTLVNMTAAQYKGAHVTPVQLLAAPGANLAIVPLSMIAQTTFVTTNYSINPQVNVGFGNSVSDILNGCMMFPAFRFGTDPSGQTAPRMLISTVTGFGQASQTWNISTEVVNQPLYWVNNTDVSGDSGDCTFTLNIQYVVVNVNTGAIVGGTGQAVWSTLTQLTSADLDPSGPITQLVPSPGSGLVAMPISLIFWNHNVPTGNPEQIELRGIFDTHGGGVSTFDLPTPSQMMNQPISIDPTASTLIGWGTTATPIDTSAFASVASWNVAQGVTVSCYIQYVIVNVATGALVQTGAPGSDLAPSYTTLSASQIKNAGSTPVQLIPAAGPNTIILPIGYVVLGVYHTTPYSPATMGGFPSPAIGPGNTTSDFAFGLPSLLNSRFYMAPNFVSVATKLFTTTYNQIAVGTPTGEDQSTITQPGNTVNVPIYYNDASNASASTMDSTGVVMVQYIAISTATGGLLTSLNPESQVLLGQCYGLSVPNNAEIIDVVAQINGKQSRQSVSAFVTVGLASGQTLQTTFLPTTDGSLCFDLGDDFTPAQLNNPAFGLGIQAFASDAPTTFDVSGMTLTVFYTPNPGVQFDYIKSFEMTDGMDLTLALDNTGTFWQENVGQTVTACTGMNATVGGLNVLTPFYNLILPDTFAVSTTEDDREFIALSNLQQGTDMPRGYDGTFLDRLSQVGPGAGPSVTENSTSYNIVNITQAPTVEIRRIVWGNVAAVPNGIGNVLTVYGPGRTYTNGQVNFASLGPNIYVGATVVFTGFSSTFPTSSGGTFDSNTENGPTVNFNLNGTYTVLSLGIHAVNGNSNELAPYFTVQAPGTTYVHSYDYLYPPDSGWFFEPTLATLQTAGPIPNLQPGDQFSVSGNSQSGYNKTWTVINDLNGAQLNITQTQETTPGVGIFTYTVASGTGPTWVQNTVYQVGQEIIDTHGYVQKVTTSGTSGFLFPTFSKTVGATTGDGGVVWTNQDKSQVTIIVTGCVNGSVGGVSPFNVTNAVITAAASPVSGSPFLVNIPDNRVLGSIAETGTAIISATLFTFDPLTIIGTGTGGTIVTAGGLGSGFRGVVTIFETREGYLTAPSPQAYFSLNTSANSLVVSNIAIGPPNVVRRIIAFTGAGGATISGGGGFYYYIPTNVKATDPNNANGTIIYTATVVPDNSSTTATFTFTDAVLLAATGISIQGNNLFAEIELGPSLGLIAYSQRLFAWGENNKIQNLVNWSFDGGTANPVSLVTLQTPLGWTRDAVNGAGGGVINSSVFGAAYQIANSTGSTQTTLGMITQSAYQDQYGNPIIETATTYSIRVTASCPTGASGGSLVVDLFSPTLNNVFGSFSLALSSLPTSGPPSITTGTLLTTMLAIVPTDLTLRLYAKSIPNGVTVVVETIEPFPTEQPVLTTQLRGSYVDNFEAFDGTTGNLGVAAENQQPVKNSFTLFDNLYIVKTHSMYETSDNGTTEPGLWSVREVSNKVGTPSIHGVDVGEGWALICGQAGLYLFTGGNPVKISPELDGDPGIWQTINWQYGYTLWIRNDTTNRHIYIGVPMTTPNKWMPNAAPNANPTQPNVVLMCNYRELMTAQALESQAPIHMTYTGKIRTFPLGRKWSIWQIPAAYADFITRSNSLQPLFLCSDTMPKIYDIVTGTHDDDGALIASDYITSPFVQDIDAEQNQLGQFELLAKYASVLAIGSGNLNVTIYPDSIDSPDAEAIYPLPLADPPSYGDTEYPLNNVGRRFFQEFSVSTTGDWFQISKLTMVLTTNPWAPVSGGTY